MKRLIQIILVICSGVFFFSSFGKSNGERYFTSLLMARSQISQLEAFGSDGSAFDIRLRFVAPKDWLNRLSYQRFVEVECGRVSSEFGFSLARIATWPLWNPKSISAPRCFQRRGANALSETGRDFILGEAEGGWVYAHFYGRKIDRNLPGY